MDRRRFNLNRKPQTSLPFNREKLKKKIGLGMYEIGAHRLIKNMFVWNSETE